MLELAPKGVLFNFLGREGGAYFVFQISAQLVYIIGLHAVQFGNNWMRKIPRTAKFGSPRNFWNPIISKLDKHVVLFPINYRASKNSLFKAKLNVRAKTIQFILNWTIQFILN